MNKIKIKFNFFKCQIFFKKKKMEKNISNDNCKGNAKQYILKKDNKDNIITITNCNNYIIFKSREYKLISNLEQLIKMTNFNFDSIDKAFDFIINLFDKRRAYISEKSKNLMKIRVLFLENETNFNINLQFNNLIPDDINTLKNIIYDSYTHYNYHNSFEVFTTINNELFLVYSTKEKYIKCFNLIDNAVIMIIKESERNIVFITNFRHFYDKYKNRDLLISIFGIRNRIKVWNVNNWDCIVDIKDIYKTGNIFSSCFINDNNNIYIITSNCTLFKNSQPLKIYDLNGKNIKDINKSGEKTFYIDFFYDTNKNKNYIITVNKDNLKSYDYENNEFYKKYQEKIVGKPGQIYDNYHYNYVINNFENIPQLIESGDDGYIRIWDFHEGNLIKKIEIDKNCIYSLCLWNSNYLFGASEDRSMKLIDLKEGVFIKQLNFHYDMVCTIKKIIHPLYGECLISQGYRKDQIKLWINKNIMN